MGFRSPTLIIIISFVQYFCLFGQLHKLKINEQGYYEIPSLNIMVFDDFYPEGHQGGISIIQFENRLASNGDVRLEPNPGQWAPVPKVGKRIIDRENGTISVSLWYPDTSKNNKGFNPIDYPDLKLNYNISTESVGNSIKLTVQLDKKLPKEWLNKVGFNIELFPGEYCGEHYLIDSASGIFPQQANTPINKVNNELKILPMAKGKQLIVAPNNIKKKIKFESHTGKIEIIDQRVLHNNGWFTLREVFTKSTSHKIEWIMTPSYDTTWRYAPVIQVSQVGFHPKQNKFAVIELDKLTKQYYPIKLFRIHEDSIKIVKEVEQPNLWGSFLRYHYLKFNFSEIVEPGIYFIEYNGITSNNFEIKNDIFTQNVWQPTLEYFLPVQMCHMKVTEKYRVWHGLCHMDDARMAPINHNHFDGYVQGNSTLTHYSPGENVPNINIGGWHDAGDYDLRVESQGGTIYKLSLAYELFKNNIDVTTIDQQLREVKIHVPDGKPDIIQQIEHGVLSIVNSYESLGRLYRGIICPTLSQYVLLGDGSTMTDNFIYEKAKFDPILNKPLPDDDRWVFTERNGKREIQISQYLAAASRVLAEYNPSLSNKCLAIAEELFNENDSIDIKLKINASAELYLSTKNKKYSNLLLNNTDLIVNNISLFSSTIGRFVNSSSNNEFNKAIENAVKNEYEKIVRLQKENPYGVPYKPYIWGAGWGIQSFGVDLLMLHFGFPNIVRKDYVFNALNFVLGCHPGINTSSFASGVGAKSLTVAYGVNRADWSYIPGGVGSGTALIRPDFPELKTWPFFWQQTEYVIGGGGTNFMLLAMAADYLYSEELNTN